MPSHKQSLFRREEVSQEIPLKASGPVDLDEIWHYTILINIHAPGAPVRGVVRLQCSVGDIDGADNSANLDWVDIEKLAFDKSCQLRFDAANVGYSHCRIVVEATKGQLLASARFFGKGNG